MTDLVWMVLAPGGGDELQGIKKGIIEMADFIIVNKADGDLMSSAKVALSHYKNAHHYNQGGGIQKEFFLCSTYSGLGIKDLWSRTMAIKEKFESTDEISRKRIQQKSYWFEKRVMDGWTSILSSIPYFKGKLEAWDAVIEVHLKGTFLCTQAAARQLMKQGEGGRIVNTTSVSGMMGNFGQTNYSAAKAGIYGLTRTAGIELQKHRITVNALAPIARTRMTEDLPMFQHTTSLTPEHVAPAALFLGSSLCGERTGHVLAVAGALMYAYKVVETEGKFKDDNQAWSAQEIADHWDSILRVRG